MLNQFLVSEVFAFLLIFCRLGSALMLMPGFGELYVSPRIRLMLALMFSLLLAPVLQNLPPVPDTVSGLFGLMTGEIAIGLFLGGLARLLITAIHIAGTIISYQASLAAAVTQGISSFQGQDTSIGNLFSLTAVVLIFAMDLDHVMLKGLADSYTLFVPGQFPLVGDFANHATQIVNGAFHAAMQMAAPSIVIGLMLYLGAGIISRLMPNMQVFFVMMPAHIVISFFIIMTVFSAVMLWYLDYFKDAMLAFVAP